MNSVFVSIILTPGSLSLLLVDLAYCSYHTHISALRESYYNALDMFMIRW